MQKTFPRSLGRSLCTFLPVAAPWLLLGLLSIVLKTNVLKANPVWADEIIYFRSLKTVCEAGWPMAANGTFEATAKLGNFGSAGLVPTLLYAPFGFAFGVTPHTILLCNVFWVSVGMLVFLLLRKPSNKVCLLLTGSLMTYVPFILYCITSMTEIFSYALILLYLAFLLTYYEKRSKVSLLFCVLTFALACLYRSYYGWLAVPLGLSIGRFRFSRKTLLSLLGLLLFGFVCCLVGECFVSTNFNSFLYRLLHAGDFYTAWRMLLSHVKSNLLDVFSRGECQPIELFLFAGYAFMMLIMLIGAFIGKQNENQKYALRFDLLGMFLLMAALLITTICLYDLRDWRGFRILAPILWMAILYTISRGDYAASGISAVIAVVSLIWLLTNPPVGAFADPDRFTEPVKNEKLTQAVQFISISDETDDPFANTVRTDLYNLQFAEELDPRMGIQYGWLTTDTVEKSHWLVTDYLRCAVTGYVCAADFGDYKVYERVLPEEVTE